MSDIEVVESNNQFIAFGKLIADDHPGSEQFERDGIAFHWVGGPLIFFNDLFLSERVTGVTVLKQRLGAAAGYMRSKPDAGLFFICEDYLDDEARAQLDGALEEVGFSTLLDTFGMVGDFLPFDEPVDHAGLRLERVTNEEALRHCADINSEAYAMPLELMRDGLKGSALWKERAFCYVGYHEGEAVSTASVIESDGSLYVALVATRPSAQRRGFGEATMRRALEVAHEATGCRRTSLHSSQAGFPMYEKMGYRRVTRVTGYGPTAPSSAAFSK